MNTIEIFMDENKVHVRNVLLTDFKQQALTKRESMGDITFDFSMLKQLKGEKIILEKAFQNEKAESINQ
jgi:hypothetical protein